MLVRTRQGFEQAGLLVYAPTSGFEILDQLTDLEHFDFLLIVGGVGV
jgi:hypothetical protein